MNNGLIMERDNNLLLNIILRGVLIITITPSTGAIICSIWKNELVNKIVKYGISTVFHDFIYQFVFPN